MLGCYKRQGGLWPGGGLIRSFCESKKENWLLYISTQHYPKSSHHNNGVISFPDRMHTEQASHVPVTEGVGGHR